jgi:dTMP kinase
MTDDLTGTPDPLATLLPGRFVVLDGPDGCGKSTQFARLSAYCDQLDVTVAEVREPGGTSIGEQIRSVLLDPANDAMVVRAEMLLYMASRAQLLAEKIAPALQANKLVLADRFISSTLAYQGTAGGLSPEEIAKVGAVATGGESGRKPDLVVLFDVDEKTAAARRAADATRHGSENDSTGNGDDRMEQKGLAFQRRVRDGYLDQVRRDPDGYLMIDASVDPDEVFAALLAGLRSRLT